MTEITSVDVQLFTIPLAEVLVDAKHGTHTHFELITATVRLRDGTYGTGYTFSFPIDHYTKRPLVVRNHMAIASDAPGIGVSFDWHKLAAANHLPE